jgi:fructokinase
MNEVIHFFAQFELDKIDIGSFGTFDINRRSNTYGYITTTPKL